MAEDEEVYTCSNCSTECESADDLYTCAKCDLEICELCESGHLIDAHEGEGAFS